MSKFNLDEKIEYIKLIWRKEDEFKNFTSPQKENHSTNVGLSVFQREFRTSLLGFIGFFEFSLLVFNLCFKVILKKPKVSLLFIAPNFCVNVNGRKELRIAKNLFNNSTLLINTSKEHYISTVDGQSVYNVGLFVKLVSFFYFLTPDVVYRNFKAYTLVNDVLLRFKHVYKDINYYWFYDLNSLTIIFSNYREHHKLVEIQHGSIINYPPYELPAPVKIADLFYVRNESTLLYLKDHLCRDFVCEYKLIPYPSITQRKIPGINILYASTIEFEGFHPVFKDFLKGMSNNLSEINLTIRLHPRERGQENLFLTDLTEFKGAYGFDNSENWLLSNAIEGLIVISPWSSTLEEAYDNGYICVTIDKVGEKRFSYYLNSERFYYSDDLLSFFKNSYRN